MTTTRLSDRQWAKIYAFLLECKHVNNYGEANMRRFIEAVLWMSRSGAPWRFLPPEYGNWNSVFKRFSRWSGAGVWQKLLEYVASDPDLEALQLDSTAIRAHPSAAGAPAEKRGQQAQALGRSRGGFGSKIHVLVDALGYPLRFRLTGAEVHDITQAEALIAGYHPDFVTADKGYDADHFIEAIENQGAEPVIPPRSNRKDQRYYDRHLYRERHLVECLVSKIKQYRRVFTRYDKLASNYLGFVCFAAALVWLK